MNSTWGAFGRWSTCAPNEFGLQRPSASGRPAPTEKASFASAEADAWRGAPGEAVQLSPNASPGAVNVFAKASRPGLRRTG